MAQRGFLLFLLVLFTVVGCQKNYQDGRSLLQYELAVKNYEKGQGVLYNNVNPFASVETTKKIQNFLSDMDQIFYKSKLDSAEFTEVIDSILEKNDLKYDKTLLSEREKEILRILFSNSNCENYLDLSTEFENIINNDNNLTAEQKMHLFKIIDFEKNLFYVILQKKKETFDDCMRRRLGDVFNNDYILSQLAWMASWPISLSAIAAECLYEVNH